MGWALLWLGSRVGGLMDGPVIRVLIVNLRRVDEGRGADGYLPA
jgi:hypothetical protein